MRCLRPPLQAALSVLLTACAAQNAARRPGPAPDGEIVETEDARIRVEVVAGDLEIPNALAFLPDGRALLGERPSGRLSLVNLRTGALTRVDGVPTVHGALDGGLLDVALHPDFARNGWIYLAYAAHTHDGTATAVDRARLVGHRLLDDRRLFTAKPSVDNSEHFGSRIVVSGGYLFITVGERNERERAQSLGDDNGKIIRLKEDGGIPPDNPFVGREGALPEIWSYGHRNPQGLAINPADGSLWEHEHGPKGGDEVNVIRPGLNYGWPVITYGREYSGEPVGEGITQKEGMEQPVYYYVPSIAPSGMTFYTGAAFPRWRGNLFLGAMALKHLNRLVLQDGKVVREERLLGGRGWRVRVVQEGPDGCLYIGVDAGLLLRLRPA